jgi:hypothetical protein
MLVWPLAQMPLLWRLSTRKHAKWSGTCTVFFITFAPIICSSHLLFVYIFRYTCC